MARSNIPIVPRCAFCSGKSNNWKVGRFWCCVVCGVNLEIMKIDKILEFSKTEQYGGPTPSGRKSKFYEE